MRINSKFTKILTLLLLTFFVQNSSYAQFIECPLSATASANSTNLKIDSGVAFPAGNFPAYLGTCTGVVSNSDPTVVVIFNGVSTTFTKQSGLLASPDNTCVVTYDAAGSDPLISPPFVIDFSGFTELCNYAASGALPVEVSKFTLDLTDEGVLLEWQTVEELNNDYFEIYRSNDAKEWEVVGIISGAGTTRQTVDYNFTDESPLIGKNYYALTQVDFDGTMQMGEIKVVSIKGGRNYISVYPNPVSQSLTVEVSEDAQFPLDINIFDSTGKLVAVDQLTDYKQTLNVDELDKGFYYLQVNSRYESISERFVKQ